MATEQKNSSGLDLGRLWETTLKPKKVNVGEGERVATGLGGGLLTLAGLRKGGLSGTLIAAAGSYTAFRAATGYCPTYDALKIDTNIEGGNANATVHASKAVKIKRSATIDRPREQLFQFWRNFENLPLFMEHLESVSVTSPTRSHWVAKAPLGRLVEWDAEIYTEKENELISWRSLEGAQVNNAGSVRFLDAPGGRGTEVHIEIDYEPPAGILGVAIAKLTGEEPTEQVGEDLRHLKMVLEAGEIITTKGQPSCRDNK